MSYDGAQGGRGKMIPGLVVLFAIFAAVLYLAVRETRKGDWPTTEGHVGRLVGEHWVELSALGRSDTRVDQIAYKYGVGDKTYQDVQAVTVDDEAAQARVARLAAQPSVIVRYDPDDPRTSFIDDGEPRNWLWGLWAGAVAAAGLLAYGVRRFRRASW